MVASFIHFLVIPGPISSHLLLCCVEWTMVKLNIEITMVQMRLIARITLNLGNFAVIFLNPLSFSLSHLSIFQFLFFFCFFRSFDPFVTLAMCQDERLGLSFSTYNTCPFILYPYLFHPLSHLSSSHFFSGLPFLAFGCLVKSEPTFSAAWGCKTWTESSKRWG